MTTEGHTDGEREQERSGREELAPGTAERTNDPFERALLGKAPEGMTPDSDGLGAWGSDLAIVGYVDEVNGQGACAVPGFVPTRYELSVLQRHWHQVRLKVEFRCFAEQQSSSLEWGLSPFAGRRVERIAQALATGAEPPDDGECARALREVEDEFAWNQDPLTWRVFTGAASPEEAQLHARQQELIHRGYSMRLNGLAIARRLGRAWEDGRYAEQLEWELAQLVAARGAPDRAPGAQLSFLGSPGCSHHASGWLVRHEDRSVWLELHGDGTRIDLTRHEAEALFAALSRACAAAGITSDLSRTYPLTSEEDLALVAVFGLRCPSCRLGPKLWVESHRRGHLSLPVSPSWVASRGGILKAWDDALASGTS